MTASVIQAVTPRAEACCGSGSGGGDHTTTTPPPQTHTNPPASCDFLDADPTKLGENGGDVTLSWGTTNAKSVSIDNGVGSVSADGSKTVHVTETTTFKLTATSNSGAGILGGLLDKLGDKLGDKLKVGGNSTCTVKVTVEKHQDNYPSCDAFSVTPDSFSNGGGTVTLRWNTTNADDVSIDHGIGDVSEDGSTTYHVTDDTTFTLTVKGDGHTDTCSDSVTVNHPNHTNLSCDLFEASDSTVDEDEDFELYWETTGADDVRIDHGIGSVADDGSKTTSVDDDTTYTLTATNNDGDEVQCHTSVRVNEEHERDDTPRCDLNISDDEIDEGDSVRLDWDNDDTDDIILKDDHGHTIIDTDDGDDYDPERDDITLKPTEDTTYKLTAINGSEKKTCTVDVEVNEDHNVVVTSYRDQTPIVLTQVPYTGFDAGPFLTGLFYTLLALWGAGVAYYLTVKRGVKLGFGRAGATDADAVSAPVAVAAQYAAAEAAVPADLPVAHDVAPTIGYAPLAAAEEETDALSALRDRAHDARVLLSSDALHFIAGRDGSLEEQFSLLNLVVANAKAMFPTEDGWMVINKARLQDLLA